jgi:hypothetical protein
MQQASSQACATKEMFCIVGAWNILASPLQTPTLMLLDCVLLLRMIIRGLYLTGHSAREDWRSCDSAFNPTQES